MKNVASQKEMVMAHLQRFGSIEPLTALRDYGCYRLGAIIYALRAEGNSIRTETISDTSMITGRPLRYARYILIKARPEAERGQTN
jgi:hypothetical protein